jgi:NADH-quinone oxidoreductase subunit J
MIGIVVAIELVLVMVGFTQADAAIAPAGAAVQPDVTNTAALGLVLYTKYFYLFQASGLVLLTAMIGAIVLTLRHKPDVKRQVIADQNARTRAGAIEIKKVPSRTGV